MPILNTIKTLVWPNPTAALSPNGHKAVSTSTYGGLSGNGEVFSAFGQRNADWSMVSDMPRIQDAYRKCAVAYACVTLIADAVAESPIRVYRTIDGELEEQPDHRLRALLANPNPYMSEAEFMSLVVATAGMFGYGIVEKVRSGAGLPVQLWPLRPDWLIRERTNQDTTRLVYRIPGLAAREIAEEDVLLIPWRHDERQTRPGISPLQIVAREIGIDVALTDLLKVFIDAGGIPPWVVKLSGDVQFDQTDADVFREKWRQRYAGSQAYSNIGILNPGMDLVKVGDSIGDMAWPDLRGLTELKICQAFRVPADLVQARDTMSGGSLTTTEMDGAMAFLQNHAAQPLRQRIDGAFTRGLLPDFGVDGSYSLEFDTSAIFALQEDRDALHARVRADWDAGMISLNEARGETGRIDLGTDGEVFKIAFTTTLTPIGDANSANGAERASPSIVARSGGIPAITAGVKVADRQYRDHKAMTPLEIETRAALLTTTRRERDKLAEIGARQLRKFFKQQGARIVDDMPKATGVVVWHKGQPWIKSFPVDGVHSKAINWDTEDELLRALMSTFYGKVGETAYGTVSAQLDVSLDWTLANPNIARVLDQLGLRIVDISETTRTDVVNLITQGQADGLSLQQIADSITGLFEETYKGRAMTIARTETQVSYNLASQLGYQESGVVDEVEMVDNPDHPDDYGASDGLTCADRDGMVVNIGQMDTHVDAEHPNGSLAFIPILSTPLGE